MNKKMNPRLTQNLKTVFAMLVLAPALSWAGITINAGNGTLEGQGHARTHNFPVIAKQFTITISDPDNSGSRSIQVSLKVKELTTNNFLRNAHMRMAVFNGDYPEITYTASLNLTVIQAGEYVLNGTLTINGKARPYPLKINLQPTGSQWHATGEFLIKLTDFDIALPGMGPMKVLDKVNLNLDVTFS